MITQCRPFLSPNQVIKAGIEKLVARLVWIFELSLPHFWAPSFSFIFTMGFKKSIFIKKKNKKKLCKNTLANVLCTDFQIACIIHLFIQEKNILYITITLHLLYHLNNNVLKSFCGQLVYILQSWNVNWIPNREGEQGIKKKGQILYKINLLLLGMSYFYYCLGRLLFSGLCTYRIEWLLMLLLSLNLN